MKAKTKVGAVIKRQPYERLDDKQKSKIVKEIEHGILGLREASRKYGIHRNSLASWVVKHHITTLLDETSASVPVAMSGARQTAMLLKQVQMLTRALEQEKLKNLTLETLIEVAESDLHIKIRKKRGTKRS